jgi:hypothetical protein
MAEPCSTDRSDVLCFGFINCQYDIMAEKSRYLYGLSANSHGGNVVKYVRYVCFRVYRMRNDVDIGSCSVGDRRRVYVCMCSYCTFIGLLKLLQ